MTTTTNTGFKGIKDIRDAIWERGERPKMVILYPANPNQKALADFFNNTHFGSVKNRFRIKKIKCPMLSKEAVIRRANFKEVRNADVLVIIRGGGNGLEVWDDKEVVRAFAKLRNEYNTVICVGIGHSADRPAIYEIADVKVTTPTELSVFFRDLVMLNKDDMNAKWNYEDCDCVQWPKDLEPKIERLLENETPRNTEEVSQIEKSRGSNKVKINIWSIVCVAGFALLASGIYFHHFIGIVGMFLLAMCLIKFSEYEENEKEERKKGMCLIKFSIYEENEKEERKKGKIQLSKEEEEHFKLIVKETIDPDFDMLSYNIFNEED